LKVMNIRRILGIMAVAMVFYFVIIVLSDIDEVADAFRLFDWVYLIPVMILIMANYLVRAERWHSFLQGIDLGIPRARSYWLFLAGLSMSITPAKAGEALKALLLRMERGAPFERGIAVVFAERMTDLTGVLFLVGIGFIVFPYGLLPFSIVVAVVVAILLTLSVPRTSERFVSFLKSRRLLKKLGTVVERALTDARNLLAGRNLAMGTSFGFIAWGAECVAFYLILVACSSDIGLMECVFVYSFASVVGAVSMMPGGMGTTEATMIALLLMLSVDASAASFAVILVRVCTLWFAVGLGIIMLMAYSKRSKVAVEA